jgi:hypothetical protein
MKDRDILLGVENIDQFTVGIRDASAISKFKRCTSENLAFTVTVSVRISFTVS